MVRGLARYGYMIRASFYAIFQKVDTTGLGGHGAGSCVWSWLWSHLKPNEKVHVCSATVCFHLTESIPF